jgi:hypothetical protein
MSYLTGYQDFLNESGFFTKEGPSDRDWERKQGTTAYKVLKFIYDKGEEGASHSEIIRFIKVEINKQEFDPVADRGYWSTNLYHKPRFSDNKPLLYTFCEKTKSGKWKLNDSTRAQFIKRDLALPIEKLIEITNDRNESPEIKKAAKENPNFPSDVADWTLSDWA